LFFKALKQNLKIKTFVGTSANALKVQVWTALIAMLVLKYLQLRSRFAWSLSNLVALLRMSDPAGAGPCLIRTAEPGILISAAAPARPIAQAIVGSPAGIPANLMS
jgi:hypothetical protein